MILKIKRNNGQILEIKPDIQDENEYMYSAFQHAKEILELIVRNAEIIRQKKQGVSFYDLYGYGCNILAISGNRGQGKTSTMLSLAGWLQNNANKTSDEGLCNASFLTLDPIDPTILEAGQNPLTLIVSRMYQKVEEAWTQARDFVNRRDYAESEKNAIINLFQSCLNEINAIKYPKTDKQPSLYEMQELSDSAKLKKNLYDLAEEVLSFCDTTSAGRKYLVVQLDDTDFQIERSYEILDDIRKYLTLPNVIILMATDLEILYDVVAQHFFDKMSVAYSNKLISSEDLQIQTRKYLDKLIPPTHVVNLPQIDQLLMSDPEALQLQFTENDAEVLPESSGLSLTDLLFRLLYEKTGIMLLDAKNGSFFIPSTLRGLMQLLNLLSAMENFQSPEEHGTWDRNRVISTLEKQMEIQEKNLNYFESYFMTSWMNSKLSYERSWLSGQEVDKCETDAHFVRELFHKVSRISNRAQQQKEIVKALNERYDNHADWHNEEYSDFLNYFQEMKKMHPWQQDRVLFCAIEMYLSIQRQKDIIRQQKSELKKAEETEGPGAVVIHYDPKGLGMSFHYHMPREDSAKKNGIANASLHGQKRKKTTQAKNNRKAAKNLEGSVQYQQTVQTKENHVTESIRKLKEKEKEEKEFAKINETLLTDGRFLLMNFIWLLLQGDVKYSKDDNPIFASEDVKRVYDAQQMAVRIATNPEVLQELVNVERSYMEDPDNSEKSIESYVAELLNILHQKEESIQWFVEKNSAEKRSYLPDHRTMSVIGPFFPPSKETKSQEVNRTRLQDWFSHLQDIEKQLHPDMNDQESDYENRETQNVLGETEKDTD